jgi:hypothetical protein
MELPSRAPCRVTVVEHGDMVTSEQNPCRFAILHRAIRTRRAGTTRAGTFFRKVREMGRDLFPKGPCECVANAGSLRLFILTSFARRFGKASLPERTLRKSVPA